MGKITVVVRDGIDTDHQKYGSLKEGMKITIEEEDFGAELFDRPSADFLSPHELADRERAMELKRSVGTHTYVEPSTEAAEVQEPTKAADAPAEPEASEQEAPAEVAEQETPAEAAESQHLNQEEEVTAHE